MLDLKWIRQNPNKLQEAINHKGSALSLENLLQCDQEVLQLKKELQSLEEKRNANAKNVSKATPEERTSLIALGKEMAKEIEAIKPKVTQKEEELEKLLLLAPLPPSPKAPIGKNDTENVVLRKHGTPPTFSFTPLDHVSLLDKRGWADLGRVGQVSGTRSYALKGEMVLLEMALWRWCLDYLQSKGMTLLSVPALCRDSALQGSGQFPTGKDQIYYLPNDDLYLSGTSEVIVNAFHAGETLKESELPLVYGAFSTCFRREAGSSGKDTRGLIRLHQFYKVEQFVLCPNNETISEEWHQKLLQTSEEILQHLELPYQVLDVCTGDMGPGKYRQYDLESWVPSEGKYRETHSCSNLHDWQARRTNLRYRDAQGTMQYVHTLNNTALATPRILVPLLECHQREDHRIYLPPCLRPYMGGKELL